MGYRRVDSTCVSHHSLLLTVSISFSAAPGEYTSVYDACMKIYEENGLSGFYRGLMPSLILVSNPAIQFVVYEQMIRIWTKAAARAAQRAIVAGAATAAATSTTPIRLSSLQYFFLGAFAKAVATLATYPYQVVKSRLQASRTSSSQSTWSLVLSMWRNEGIGSFYAGMNAKMSQTGTDTHRGTADDGKQEQVSKHSVP